MTSAAKLALISGSGAISRRIAIRLAHQGYSIAILSRNASTRDEIVHTLHQTQQQQQQQQHHHHHHHHQRCYYSGHQLDLSVYDESHWRQVIANTIEQSGGHQISTLVNCAGVTLNRLMSRTTATDFQTLASVNINGTWHLTQAVVRTMLAATSSAKATAGDTDDDIDHHHHQLHRSIINVGSVVGEDGHIGQAAYSASKSWLSGFTKSMAQELGTRGICVNTIAPGFIDDTRMTSTIPSQQRDTLIQQTPLRRFGTCDDVANVVAFLASKESSFITGQVIRVDGGLKL